MNFIIFVAVYSDYKLIEHVGGEWGLIWGWWLCRQETEHYFSSKHLFCLPLYPLPKKRWLALTFPPFISPKNVKRRLFLISEGFQHASVDQCFSNFHMHKNHQGADSKSLGGTQILCPHFEDPTSRCLSQDNQSWTHKTQGGIQLKTGKTKQKCSFKSQLAMSHVCYGHRKNTSALFMHIIF